MKQLFILLISITFLNFNMTGQTFQNENDKVSYAFGLIIAGNLKSQGVKDINSDMMAAGIQAALTGKDAKMDAASANQVVQAFMMKAQESAGAEQKKEGADFLAANKSKPGIKTTESGLQYEVLKEGTGASPVATDKVLVHYHGTLINGKVFDSSVDRGEPISFPLNGVISGWTEGLQLMKEGGKTRFYIPENLAYGARGAGADIKPYSTLIFDVELINIVKE